MSGGSFDYAYSRIREFADALADRLDTEPEFPHDESVRQRLRRLVSDAHKVATLARETEWLYSGDHSEETFLKLVEKIDAGTDA